MKTIIVYHQTKPGVDCPDGICAAWVVSQKFPDFELVGDVYLNNEDYQKENYQLPFDPTGQDVVIVDFSYPKAILGRIADRANKLYVLDHHKTRMGDIESLSDRIRGGYDADECGATFAWKYFMGDRGMPWFLPHVRDRDIGTNGYYEGEIPHSEAINTAISARRKGLIGAEAFPVFDQLLKETPQDLINEGLPAIEERNRLVEEALNQYNGAMLQVGEYLVPYYQIANPKAHRHYSVIGSAAARKHTEAPFIAIVTDDPTAISLRASKASSVDVGEIAKSLGGGGHARAAGYKLSR